MKPLPWMLFFLAVAATVLASPPPLALAAQLPKGAVFQVIDRVDATVGPTLHGQSGGRDAEADTLLGGLLAQLAVVKPHRSGRDAPSTLRLFVLIAPTNGQVAIRAFGSF
ncbi:MAG: hypothetical protein ACXWK4_01595 [Myxococcaceae bacterium]